MSHDRPLTPAERERLAQELLELHFGCHEDPTALRARLAAEPALRALQADVLQQAQLLERAVRPPQAPLALHEPNASAEEVPAVEPFAEPTAASTTTPTATPTRSAPSRWRWLRTPVGRLFGAAAAAAAAVLGCFVAERVADHRHAAWQREHLHVTVSAPRAVPAGAPFSFTIQTRDLAGAAVDAKVAWAAHLADGSVLRAAETATRDGSATITLAADAALRVPDRITVVASTAHDSVRHVLPLSTAAAGPLVHVSTDRPVYRPGETVFVRAVVLDRVTRLPLAAAQRLRARLLDAKDAPVADDTDALVPAGVGTFVLPVAAASAGGAHTVRIESLSGAFPAEEVEIVVRSFQPPQLRKEIVLDRASYAPGARGSAAVTVQRLAAGGGGAVGASARGALVVDGTEVWSERRVLGALGEATFAFVVPKDVGKGAARFVATIDDGGIVETEVRPFVVPTGKVLVAAFPEGGELVAGVENGLYLELTDPLGRPVDESGEVLDERGQRVAKFRTTHQGRAKVALVPRRGASYHVRLVGQPGPFALPAVAAQGIALRLLGDDVAAAEPLRVAVAGRGDGPWLLGVFCRGVLVGQTTLRAGEGGELRERVDVPLPPTATGVLRATVFDRELRPVAERLVRRHAAQRLDVALLAQNPALAPGDTQRLAVRTTDETGAARPAVVGIGVSDLAALSLGSEPRVGLVDHALLFADVERMENLGDFFVGAGASGSNVDLLLGTRGWRRFVWRNDAPAQAAIAARGKAADGVLAREGFSHTPQVLSNLDAARAGGSELARAARGAERMLADVATAALLLLILFAATEGIAQLLRTLGLASSLLRVGLGAAASVALLMLVMVTRLGGEAMVFEGSVPAPAGAVDFAVPESKGTAPLWTPPPQEWIALGTNGWNTDFDDWGPRANPLAGAFYNDGVDGDIRGGIKGAFAQSKTNLPLLIELDKVQELQNHANLVKAERASYDAFWRERQYAHVHTPSDDRRDFAPTICWHTLVATDERGEASVAFATSDAVTTWRVHADAHAPTGTGRLGQASLDFTTRLPLHVECKLPDEVSAGDRLQVPVTAVVTDPALTEVALEAKVGGGLRLGDGAPTRIVLRDGRGRALLPLVVDAAPGSGTAGSGTAGSDTAGSGTLALAARAGRFTDRLQHTVAIAPRGFPHRRSLGGTVAAGEPSTGTLVIPAEHVAGTGRVTLRVFPSPVTALTAGLAGILREPHGCFEQASSANYPNTLVLNLLEASGDDVPVVAARARALLPAGYAKIVGFECKQRGFEWFGADPGHEALTAYGLLQFHDMARVHDVDAAMVERTRAWLLARRDGKGGYGRNDKSLDRFGGASAQLTNAYVTFVLLQSGTPAPALAAEIDALLARRTSDDPYELALIAGALHLAGRPEAAAARQSLAALQRADGSLRGTTTSITSSGGADLVVETTGFAILAWLPDAAFAANVNTAVDFVQSQRSAAGTFGATQATIVALRALTAYATAHRTMRAPGTLRVFAGDRQLAERAFAATESAALTFELWQHLAPGEHTLRVEVDGGGGPLPWACDVAYHAEQPADDPDGAVAIATSLRAGEVAEGATVALDVTVTNRTERELPTPIAIVGLPAGCELPTRVLEDLQQSGAFAAWELRGRELVLYWRALAPAARQQLTLDLIARVPGVSTAPAARAYLYYTPAAKRWAAPVALTIAAR